MMNKDIYCKKKSEPPNSLINMTKIAGQSFQKGTKEKKNKWLEMKKET